MIDKPHCPSCDSMSVDSLGESDVSFGDAFPNHQDTLGCKDCGLIYLDCEYTEEMWVNT